jgi:hypothetical protein
LCRGLLEGFRGFLRRRGYCGVVVATEKIICRRRGYRAEGGGQRANREAGGRREWDERRGARVGGRLRQTLGANVTISFMRQLQAEAV